jgi:hypothetical protein
MVRVCVQLGCHYVSVVLALSRVVIIMFEFDLEHIRIGNQQYLLKTLSFIKKVLYKHELWEWDATTRPDSKPFNIDAYKLYVLVLVIATNVAACVCICVCE